MSYAVKEIYYTLQGEGAKTGKPAVFCRFTGCNLWSGREADRPTAACRFCDTDFVGTNGPNGGVYSSAQALAEAINDCWPHDDLNDWSGSKMVVCTGGEPLLQLDEAAVEAFHEVGFEVAVETNGTKIPPRGVDWVCVSPKVNSSCILTSGDELKLVFPQLGCDPAHYASWDFDHFFLQPLDGPDRERNTRLATEFCLQHPKWELSLQTHKLIGLR